MPWEEKLKLGQIKSKNNKTKSAYLHLCDANIGRSRALITFTTASMKSKQYQLIKVKDIKNYFAKKLQNLKVDIQYMSVIELGIYKTNPHLHFQLFYNKENIENIEKAYKKTIDYFNLKPQRCDFKKEDPNIQHNSSFNYIIKEFDNSQLSDQEILDLDSARKKIKQGSTKYTKLYSISKAKYPRSLYKKLWYDKGLNYLQVNELMTHYAKRLQGQEIKKAKQSMLLPFILFKDGAININTSKLSSLILFPLLILHPYIYKSSEKCIYNNKRNNSIAKTKNYKYFHKNIINRIGLSNIKVKTDYTVIIV